jgi:hypothetical protein
MRPTTRPAEPMSTINKLFLVFTAAVGLVIGLVLIQKPEARDFAVSPFFWVLLAMAVFELAAFARGQGALGSAIRMEVRLLGLVLAVGLMVIVPMMAGSPGRLF